MRNLMKRRRRRVVAPVDPFVQLYDQIYDLDNLVTPVLFDLAEYRGQVTLWQDLAGETTPVTDIDDPIGCVRHGVTGEILTQATDLGVRCVWGGKGVGAIFDSSIHKVPNRSRTNHLHQTDSTVLFVATYDEGTSANQTMCASNANISFFTGVVFSLNDAGANNNGFRAVVSTSDFFESAAYDGTLQDALISGLNIISASYGGTDPMRVYNGGDFVGEIQNDNELDFTGDSDRDLFIGAVNESGSIPYSGNIRAQVFFDDQKSAGEHAELAGLFQL